MAHTPALTLCNITRTFHQGDVVLTVLNKVNIEIYPGEIVALVGPSGSGKSTLLQIAGLLDLPTSGSIFLGGKEAVSDKDRTELRRNNAGFVYQFHHLLPEFSALENVIIPQLLRGSSLADITKKAKHLLDLVGLSHRFYHRPSKLSGGEQQRVALARALANDPHLLIADEPTGNLDDETANHIFSMLLKIVKDQGVCAFVATHHTELSKRMDRIFQLQNGDLTEITR